VPRYWSINTAATAVPLSAHPSRTKLAAAMGGGVRRCSAGPILPLWLHVCFHSLLWFTLFHCKTKKEILLFLYTCRPDYG